MKLVNKTQTVTLAEGCTVNPITGPPFHYIYGTNLGAPDFKKILRMGKKKKSFLQFEANNSGTLLNLLQRNLE